MPPKQINKQKYNSKQQNFTSLFGTCAAHPSGHQIAALPIKCAQGQCCGQRFRGRTSIPQVCLFSSLCFLFFCFPHFPHNPPINSLPSTTSQIASVFRFMFREKHLIPQGKIKSALLTTLTLPLTESFNGQQWESLGPLGVEVGSFCQFFKIRLNVGGTVRHFQPTEQGALFLSYGVRLSVSWQVWWQQTWPLWELAGIFLNSPGSHHLHASFLLYVLALFLNCILS